jgi:hypothetical protein
MLSHRAGDFSTTQARQRKKEDESGRAPKSRSNEYDGMTVGTAVEEGLDDVVGRIKIGCDGRVG